MAEVRNLWIEGPEGRLEALLRVANPARATAVLAHPHPLHGGTMNNPVVFHADRELNRAGFTTLRFNFRGVGSSDGIHDEGHGEVRDVAAAIDWLRGLGGGVPRLFVGYSFGSWCGFRYVLETPDLDGMVAIGLPVRVYDFEEIRDLQVPVAVVQGAEDDIGSPDEVRKVLDDADPEGRLYVVPNASHLFPGLAPEAAARVLEAAEALITAAPPR